MLHTTLVDSIYILALASLSLNVIELRQQIMLHTPTFLGHYRPLLRPTLDLFFITFSSPVSPRSPSRVQLVPILDSSPSKSGEQTTVEGVIRTRKGRKGSRAWCRMRKQRLEE